MNIDKRKFTRLKAALRNNRDSNDVARIAAEYVAEGIAERVHQIWRQWKKMKDEPQVFDKYMDAMRDTVDENIKN